MDLSKIDIRKFECVAVFFPNFIWASNDPIFAINDFSTLSSSVLLKCLKNWHKT